MAGSPDETRRVEAARLAERITEPLDVRARNGGGGPAVERETVRLPNQRGRGLSRSGRRRAPLPVAALVAAVWAALTSYLPVAVALWLVAISGGGPSLGGTGRLALGAWLLAHGVPLDTAAGPFGLVPLAVAALVAWRLARAGVHVTRATGARRTGSVPRALSAAAAVAVAYGLLGGLAGMTATGTEVTVSPLRAALTLAGFAAAAAGFGALRCAGALTVLGVRTPPVLRDALRTGLVAALLVLAAGAALTGVALALRAGPASDTLAAYRTGVAGEAGIALVCAAYAPNLAAWSAAYLVGPGFAVGAGTVVRATEVTVGTLPAIPTLAALPEHPLPMVATILLGAPLLAGMVAGVLLARRHRRHPAARGGLPAVLAAAVLAGPVAGALLGLAALASSGPLGSGRLAQVGPEVGAVAGVGAGVVAVGALIGALATHTIASPHRP